MIDKDKLRAKIEQFEGLTKFLRSLLGEGTSDDDVVNPADVGAMDGRRRMRPPSAADRAMFDASNGLSGRRIRNLGN
jgi:hypothetical protein